MKQLHLYVLVFINTVIKSIILWAQSSISIVSQWWKMLPFVMSCIYHSIYRKCCEEIFCYTDIKCSKPMFSFWSQKYFIWWLLTDDIICPVRYLGWFSKCVVTITPFRSHNSCYTNSAQFPLLGINMKTMRFGPAVQVVLFS